jgi:hypothetical protein
MECLIINIQTKKIQFLNKNSSSKNSNGYSKNSNGNSRNNNHRLHIKIQRFRFLVAKGII